MYMALRVMAVAATKLAAPKAKMDSCRNERADVMGVLSYAGSGDGRGSALEGVADAGVMTRAIGNFCTASMCAYGAMQVLLAGDSGKCSISVPCCGPAGASSGVPVDSAVMGNRG